MRITIHRSGTGGARKLAEITAATVLAGELSMGGAIGSGEFVEVGSDRREPVGTARVSRW